MRQAADTLRQANDRAGCDIEATQSWTPRRLERIAEVWERDDLDERRRQDALVDELARVAFEVANIGEFDPDEGPAQLYLDIGRRLLTRFDIHRREGAS
jgi:hypothetical protein